REGPGAGEVGVEEERLSQGTLRRIERVEPRLRHLGELCRVDGGNLLAQRRVVAKGKSRLWWRLGHGMHTNPPDQEEHNQHPCHRPVLHACVLTSSPVRPQNGMVLAGGRRWRVACSY